MRRDKVEKPLAEFVQVRQSGLRSINVEQDAGRAAIAEGYTLTPQARSTLARMLDRLTEPSAPSRAWTLTGPYGSGKSYFSLFLMNLLCATLPAHQHVTSQLKQVDPRLYEQVRDYAHLAHTKGFLPVPITGYRAALHACLVDGIKGAIDQLLPNEALSKWFQDAQLSSKSANTRQTVAQLGKLGQLVTSPELGYTGLLLVLDEMGKPLEHLANHPESGDIYLLQEIAEYADRCDYPVIFVGILHQGFERYAGHLDMTTQREWSKVHGRFADIAFQEPPHQQMGLVARALVRSEKLPAVDQLIEQYVDSAVRSGWKPPLTSIDEFRQLSQRAYPLHPTTLVALPHLFRRLAQNERSLFSYLGSLEPFAFQEFLQTNEALETVRLHNLFDYLVANFQGRLYASMRGRMITETVERLQSAPNLSSLATKLLKTIGLVSWLSEVSDLRPTKATLVSALQSPSLTESDIETALDKLLSQSLVVFRRFNESYAIWQGSDVDLDERMQAAQQNLQGIFRLAHTVEQYMEPQPVVPRRHSYRTGFMRFWQMRYVDSTNRDDIERTTHAGFAGTVLLCLPVTKGDHEDFITWSLNGNWRDSADFVIGVAQETARIAQLAQELRCLHWVRDNTPELRDDPVARRELRTRINAVENLIRGEIDRKLSSQNLSRSGGCRWFYKGEEITAQFGRGLSYFLSSISDRLYPDSPRVWNELLNRRVLSSQGAAARRNLIEAMWLHERKPQLGITGFPPERSMYESLLRSSGLHRLSAENEWSFLEPPAEDSLRLRPVWKALEEWVFDEKLQQRSVQDLFTYLSQPPYGLTEGVLPVLLCAFVLANRNETTLYREGTLLPDPGIADWEVLLRRPELFSVVGIRVEGPRAAIINRLARGLQTEPAVLPVVRELVRQLGTLPEFTWRTKRLARQTITMREAVDQARSPERLLFYDLPVALELPPFTNNGTNQAQLVDAFFERLNASLQELAQALPASVERARDELLMACGFAAGDEGWEAFRREAAVLQPYVSQPNLAPLLKRAAETAEPSAALDSVLAYIANRPPRSWSDSDLTRFRDQAARFGQLFRAERSGYDPLAALSPVQRHEGEQIASHLRQYVDERFDAHLEVKRAALRVVLKQLDDLASSNGHSETND